jgi:hypothetical protein
MASRALSLKLRYGLSLVCIVPPRLVLTLESYSLLYITIFTIKYSHHGYRGFSHVDSPLVVI